MAKIEEINNSIIIDAGNFLYKIGMLSDSIPRPPIRSIASINDNDKTLHFSKDIYSNPSTIIHPILKNGEITSQDIIEKFYHHLIFNELKQNVINDKSVLLTSHLNTSKYSKEISLSIFFELFGIPYFYLGSQPLVSLYSAGKITGMVYSCGGYSTSCTPIFEGSLNAYSSSNDLIGGEDCTKYLADNFDDIRRNNNSNISELLHNDFYREIKENYTKISKDYNSDITSASNNHNSASSITLPDGKSLELGNLIYSTGEVLFNNNGRSIINCITASLLKTELEYKPEIYNNIILIGGSFNYSSIQDRLLKEINNNKQSFYSPKIVNINDKINSSWIGGSVICNLSSFQQMWISKEDFEECGPSIIHRKCL